MSYFSELDEIKRRIEESHPGWQVWYSPRLNRTVVWCARPNPLLNEASPEQLAEAIEQADAARQAGADS
jgi:hypothetical protein